MSKKNKFDADYSYSVFNPLHWTSIAKGNFILSLLLLVDLIIGLNLVLEPLNSSYFTRNVNDGAIYEFLIPLFSYVIFLLFSIVLNEDIDDYPYFGVVAVKSMLYLGGIQFTILGYIAEFILDLICSIIIIGVLVFAIVFDTKQPLNSIQAILLGIFLLLIHTLINIIFLGFRINEIWAIIFILLVSVGAFLIHKNISFIPAIVILILVIVNNYFIAFGINGVGAGTLILLGASIMIMIRDFP